VYISKELSEPKKQKEKWLIHRNKNKTRALLYSKELEAIQDIL
jgi:hypothetical protein